MARNRPFYLDPEGEVKRGPSYMMALENANLVSQNTFSIQLSPYGEQSHIDFGTPQAARMKHSNWVQYIELENDFFWSAKCQGFAIGQTSNSWKWGSILDSYDTVSSGSVYSIFDTGSSAIIFPRAYFARFLVELYSGMGGDEYELASGYVMSKCYPDFPTLYFMFDGRWVSVDPEEYVVDISDPQDGSICVLLLSEGDQAFFVMGLPLYMNYYTIHDDTQSRIGFVPHQSSAKDLLQSDQQPTRVFESSNPEPGKSSALSWIIAVVLVCGFLCVWLCLISETMAKYPSGLQPGYLCLVLMAFTGLFSTIVFWYVQPILDRWIRDRWGEPAEAAHSMSFEQFQASHSATSPIEFVIYLIFAAVLAWTVFTCRKPRA